MDFGKKITNNNIARNRICFEMTTDVVFRMQTTGKNSVITNK